MAASGVGIVLVMGGVLPKAIVQTKHRTSEILIFMAYLKCDVKVGHSSYRVLCGLLTSGKVVRLVGELM